MAVQAQFHPSNLLLLDRTDQQERKQMMDLRFTTNGVIKNPAKRARADSTTLCLSFEDQHLIQTNTNNNLHYEEHIYTNPILSEELTAQIANQKQEIERFLLDQGELLRRAIAEKQRRHYKVLLLAAEEVALRRIREKETEIDRAVRRSAELEDRLNRVRAESMAWQAKALSDQAAAASLHAQLQQAAARKGGDCEAGPAEDAESGCYGPDRTEPDRSCRVCRVRPACVVVFPCRHLCMCEGCEVAAGGDGDGCPVCCCVRTGSLRVFFS